MFQSGMVEILAFDHVRMLQAKCLSCRCYRNPGENRHPSLDLDPFFNGMTDAAVTWMPTPE